MASLSKAIDIDENHSDALFSKALLEDRLFKKNAYNTYVTFLATNAGSEEQIKYARERLDGLALDDGEATRQ